MRATNEILEDFHPRLTGLAELQGEDCPSFDDLQKQIHTIEYKYLDKWLQSAPPPDTPAYINMRKEHITKVVPYELRPIVLPKRHAQQSVEHSNKDWASAFQKVGQRLAGNEDAMLALLGPRGTGKTQMAVELIRFMAKQRVEINAKATSNLERWAWNYNSPSPSYKGFALYSNTMDFFLRLRKTYQPDAEQCEDRVLYEFIRPELLILDEVHDRRGSDWENQMFTYLIDRRYQSANKQTIFIANQTTDQFEDNIGSSIADRIQECGGTVNCNWKSFRVGR